MVRRPPSSPWDHELQDDVFPHGVRGRDSPAGAKGPQLRPGDVEQRVTYDDAGRRTGKVGMAGQAAAVLRGLGSCKAGLGDRYYCIRGTPIAAKGPIKEMTIRTLR